VKKVTLEPPAPGAAAPLRQPGLAFAPARPERSGFRQGGIRSRLVTGGEAWAMPNHTTPAQI